MVQGFWEHGVPGNNRFFQRDSPSPPPWRSLPGFFSFGFVIGDMHDRGLMELALPVERWSVTYRLQYLFM